MRILVAAGLWLGLFLLSILARRHISALTDNLRNRIDTPGAAPSSPLPWCRKLWQTAKAPPFSLELEYQTNIRRWADANPSWRYELLTDLGSDEYVRKTFAHDPEIVQVYTTLKDTILRADLFRYLVLLGDGGVYSDLDTEVLKPIDSWIPEQYREAASVVVGIEYDSFGLGRGQALLDLQLVNWTIMSRGQHVLLRNVVRNVLAGLRALADRQNVNVADVVPNFNDVLATTGPAQLTVTTWAYLSAVTGTRFSWRNVTGITEPVLVHDVLIMPVTSFANGQTHSGSGPKTDGAALVHHQFKGSWKTGSHAYGQMKAAEGEGEGESKDAVEG